MPATGQLDQKQLDFTPIRADGQNPFTADQSLGGFKLTNSAPPVAGGDLVNKDYADTLIAGLAWKAPCFVATTANITLSGPQTIDGVAVVPGNRVLVKDQTISSQNGLYIVAAGAWVRSPDANSTPELDGAATYVLTGTINAGKTFIQTTADPVIGADPIVFVQFGSLNGSVASVEIDGLIKTDGNFASLNPIPGTTKVFTTGRAGRTFFSLSCYASGFVPGPSSNNFGINIDGTDYTISVVALNNGAGGDFTSAMPLAGSISVPLAAGVHTCYLTGGAVNLGLVASPTSPMTLTIIYPNLTGGVATASPLAMQEEENVTGVATVNGTTAYIAIPNTLMQIVLSAPQVVDFEGLATIGLSGSFNSQLGIRINGVDYNGTGARSSSSSGNDRESVFVNKAKQLGAGTHTAELVLRQAIATAGNAATINSVDLPTRLTAKYTVPQAVTPAVFSLMVFAARVSGNIVMADSAGAWVDVPGPGVSPTFDLVFTPSITGKARVTVQGSAFCGSFYVGMGLNVNGVDLLPAGTDVLFGSPAGPHGYALVGNEGAGTFGIVGSLGFSVLIDVVAGVQTTVRLRHIASDVGGDGVILAAAGHPLTAHVEYN